LDDAKIAEAAALNNRACAFMESGKAAKATGLLEKALCLDPWQAEISLNLAYALKADGRPGRALEILRRVQAGQAGAKALEGLIHYEAGDYDSAEACYAAALAVDPGHRDALNDLGVLRFVRGDYPSACDCFEKAVAADPDSADAWFNLADACRELGRAARAAEADKRYAKLSSGRKRR
jgi:tetratricopeptide (TPR) repeat protein